MPLGLGLLFVTVAIVRVTRIRLFRDRFGARGIGLARFDVLGGGRLWRCLRGVACRLSLAMIHPTASSNERAVDWHMGCSPSVPS